MKIDYLISKPKKAKTISLRHIVLTLFFMLSVSFAFAQETAVITTTSNDSNWSAAFQNIGGLSLQWQAVGPGINLSGTGDTPTFDFSPNAGNGVITITITSNDNFDFTTQFSAPARDIVSIDISNLDNLAKLELPNNLLTTIDLSANIALTDLLLDNNALNAIDLSTNTALVRLELNNNNLISLDLSANSALFELTASNNNLTTLNLLNNLNLSILVVNSNQLTTIDISNNSNLTVIDLNFNLLTTAAIGQVLNDVDAYGSSGFLLKLQGNPGTIPASAINAYNNLLSRGWTIVPPVFYDFGDAPNSYTTDLASGGPQHIIGVVDLKIGLVVDDELLGFPSANADGDDLDNVNDEDGVAAANLAGILTSTDTFSIDVDVTNNATVGANLYGWIDFDGSGTFDADEFTSIAVPNGGTGVATLTWTNIIANGINASSLTFARFRITTDVLASNQPGGIVNNGEVEDYPLSIELDTDNDGIGDASDLDADNDGILNTDEIGDTNGNGTNDMLELDSDGDTCLDVTEAGYIDGDGDGILGTSPVVVDANGLITDDALGPIGGNGFTTPNDLDNNSIFDFQEAGLAATITTEPTDQDLIIGVSTFSIVAVADTFQWEESQDGGTTWVTLVDGGDYAGAMTADLMVTNSDVSKLTYRYRVIINNIAYACDPTTTSVEVTYITPDDFDLDGIFDIVDVDDDNDGILDTVEENGDINRDTDGDGNLDRVDLDADGDGCFDVTEAGFTDNGVGMLGTVNPPTVDPTGLVTSTTDGYTPPNDLDVSGTPDFQEAGLAATITTEPTDQDLIIGVSTFSIVAVADTFQWEESQDGGTTWVALVDGGDYAGTTTADLMVTNSDVSKLTYRYRVIINNIAYACDPTTTSVEVTYITPDDFDLDGIFDIVDVDDDNDGILDTVEENGDINRDTDGDGNLDRVDLDADGDGCFDVTEAGFTDNGVGMLGTVNPPTVDPTGLVTSTTDGYTPPNDLNTNGTPDFQEAGVAANITTQPVDQDLIPATSSVFTVITDLAAGDESYQWEESIDNGATWNALAEGGDYTGTTTASLSVFNSDFTKVNNRYRILVSNIAYACDPITTSTDVTFITPGDFDKDGVPDLTDFDDDNDGILDTVEENGDINRDTDGDGNLDRVDLDADGDGCFDVAEAGFTDNNGDGMLGDFPITVDVNGQVTSGSDGYTAPNDLDSSGTPDFQEAGAAATITTQPTDQNLTIGTSTFSILTTGDTYQWRESQDGGTTWIVLVDGGDYAGTTTADLMVTNSDVVKLNYKYMVTVSSIAYACDPTINSDVVGYIAPNDFDNDGIFDIFDVDADNDGILNVNEPGHSDSDISANDDWLNLDADGDGCFDVKEAGFTDGDGDGMLGSAPITVDASGQVTSGSDGYTAPNDLDGSGTPDFQEAGVAATITTQPVDQNLIPGNTAIFSVVANADTYQWEESQDGGTTWVVLIDQGNYSGSTTADLTIANLVVGMNSFMYRATVNNIGYACDPTTVSSIAQFVILTDTDNDGVPDLIDVDDDNDGILDTVEDNGIVDRDTDNDGDPDRIDLDSDGDSCFDVTEAGFTDNGIGMLGTLNPPTVDATGMVTSTTDGYTTPNDLDNNGTPDFQEAGVGAVITTDPVNQDFVLNGSATFSVTANGDTYQWEESSDGVNWTSLVDGGDYSGTNTANLTVSSTTINNYFSSYRVVVSNISYACDPGAISLSATYNTLTDTDNDGVFDIVDLDADNDGILDTVEGEFTDSNLDGTPDKLSLDSDGDTCSDVTEAGFIDLDGDGILGSSPVTVDLDGIVLNQGGYTTPNDLDNNGVFDFQEAGSPSEINNQPEDVTIALGSNAIFEVSGNATFYQWQESIDGGSSWSDLVNGGIYSGVDTDRLTITGARGRLEGNMYRVLLTSPDYACDPNPELFSDEVRLIFNTEVIPSGFSPNGDGINELFIIPGLLESPNFTMEVFDRWGNKVYEYANKGSLNPDWWDGRSTGNMNLGSGELVPAGTYFYLINFNDGNKAPRKGWVYINY